MVGIPIILQINSKKTKIKVWLHEKKIGINTRVLPGYPDTSKVPTRLSG